MKVVVIDDVSENHLVITIGHKNNLQVLIPVFGNDLIENVGQQPASFLNRIQPRRPEKDRCLIILQQSQFFLQKQLVFSFARQVIIRTEF